MLSLKFHYDRLALRQKWIKRGLHQLLALWTTIKNLQPTHTKLASSLFLFSKHLNENSCLSLALDAEGQIAAPLAKRQFSEIKDLQKTTKQTILLSSSEAFSFFSLELPLLTEKKARLAIPFALEEKLAQSVEQLHFAFDKRYYQDGRYLVVVADKNTLSELISKCREKELRFDSLTLDWFALQKNECCLLDNHLIIHDEQFKGSLNQNLWPYYFAQSQNQTAFFKFSDGTAQTFSHSSLKEQLQKEEGLSWLAKRLQQLKPMNLCQGDLQQNKLESRLKQAYGLAGLMFCLWVISLILTHSMTLYSLNKKINRIDEQIATIYHDFFPEARQVISPKFRINQLLQTQQGAQDSAFWSLLDKLIQNLDLTTSTLTQLRYQGQTLLVSLQSQDFASLENLESRLKQAKIKLRQTQASTQDGKVAATLELR